MVYTSLVLCTFAIMVIVASGNISSPNWDAWDLSHLRQQAKQRLGRGLFGGHSVEDADSLAFNPWQDPFGEDDRFDIHPGTKAEQQDSPRRIKSLWPSVSCQHYECDDSQCQVCAMKDDDSVIYLDDQVEDPTSLWLPSLHLNYIDKAELISGEMLSDKHINAAQKLLAAQFPDIGGFQNTLLSQTSFRPVTCQRDSVQILHTRGNHWIVTSCIEGVLEVYDTLYHTVSRDLLKQIEEMYVDCPRDAYGDIIYTMPQIQQQKGYKDCGLFAIAIAFELGRGFDISNCHYRQWEMREHFYKCLSNECLTSFPSSPIW